MATENFSKAQQLVFFRLGGFSCNFPRCWSLTEAFGLPGKAGTALKPGTLLCACLQLHFLLNTAIQTQLSSTPTTSESSSPLSVTDHNTSRKNIFSELLILDIPQAGNPTLCKHIPSTQTLTRLLSSAQTLTRFLSSQGRDSFMLPGFWSALVLISVL